MSAYVYAITEASVWVDGDHYTTHVDQAWESNHPFVKARPDLFRSDPADPKVRVSEPEVEQATAAPGEKRTTKRTTKRAARNAD